MFTQVELTLTSPVPGQSQERVYVPQCLAEARSPCSLEYQKRHIGAVNMTIYGVGTSWPKTPKAIGSQLLSAILAQYFASNLQVAHFCTIPRNLPGSCCLSPRPLSPPGSGGAASGSGGARGSLHKQWVGSWMCPLKAERPPGRVGPRKRSRLFATLQGPPEA